MTSAAPREATYADLRALPAHHTGQIVFGVLYAFPRPAPGHAQATSGVGELLGDPFKRHRGGPGGWIILDEPALHLGRHVLVPDLAGWRRERLPEKPKSAYIEVATDWVCEVLAPSTAALDRGDKLAVYATSGVPHVWLVDTDVQTLEVLELDPAKGKYLLRDVFSGDADIHAVPFDAVPFRLGALWAW
jgi:Uma2 family endonuclease